MLGTQNVQVTTALPGAYEIPSQVVGQIARQEVLKGQQITSAITTASSTVTNIDVPAGYRAMSVMVDQVSGVGTLIKTGDFVDMLIRMDIKPVVVNEDGTSATAIDAIDGDTSKLLLQGMQVLGTLLPPPPAAAGGATPQPGTALTERQELVILAVTPAQAEVVKWAQNDAQVSMSLVLRSPDDFIDAERKPHHARIALSDNPAACNAADADDVAGAGRQRLAGTGHAVPLRDHAGRRARHPDPAVRRPGGRHQRCWDRRVTADAGARADAVRVAGRVTGTVGDTRRRRQARRARRITIRPAPVGTPPIATHSSDP